MGSVANSCHMPSRVQSKHGATISQKHSDDREVDFQVSSKLNQAFIRNITVPGFSVSAELGILDSQLGHYVSKESPHWEGAALGLFHTT